MHHRAAIVVFARAPGNEPKHLGLGARAERRLHSYLLRRTLDLVSTVGGADVVVAFAGRVDSSDATHSVDQRGDSFGSRFVDVLRQTREMGYERLVVVGTDTPGLRAVDLEHAVRSREAVVGPSSDGGFYLLGIDADMVERLEGLPWQTPRLRERLLPRIDSECAMLPTRSDLDCASDVLSQLSALARGYRALTGRALHNAPFHGARRGFSEPVRLPTSITLSTNAPRGPPPII